MNSDLNLDNDINLRYWFQQLIKNLIMNFETKKYSGFDNLKILF